MSRLSLNRTKDLGDAKHNRKIDFRLAIVDSAAPSGHFLNLTNRALFFAPWRLGVMISLAKAQRRRVKPLKASNPPATNRPCLHQTPVERSYRITAERS